MQIKNFDFSNVKNVVFNLDGVLTNSDQNTFGNWLNAGNDLQLPSWDVVWMFFKCYGTSIEQTKQTLLDYNVDLPVFLKAINKYSESDRLELNPHAIELLRLLKSKSVAIGAVTNLNNVEMLNKELKITEYLSNTTTTEGIISKPHPDIYVKAMKAMRADPKHTVIVEDSTYGIESALHSGAIAVIAVENLQNHLPYEEAPQVFVAKDIADVIRSIRA